MNSRVSILLLNQRLLPADELKTNNLSVIVQYRISSVQTKSLTNYSSFTFLNRGLYKNCDQRTLQGTNN